jgi:hypothetical protein
MVCLAGSLNAARVEFMVLGPIAADRHMRALWRCTTSGDIGIASAAGEECLVNGIFCWPVRSCMRFAFPVTLVCARVLDEHGDDSRFVLSAWPYMAQGVTLGLTVSPRC